jgi:hypothetical protein
MPIFTICKTEFSEKLIHASIPNCYGSDGSDSLCAAALSKSS